MIDMLVRLYHLPDSGELYRASVEAQVVTLRQDRTGLSVHIDGGLCADRGTFRLCGCARWTWPSARGPGDVFPLATEGEGDRMVVRSGSRRRILDVVDRANGGPRPRAAAALSRRIGKVLLFKATGGFCEDRCYAFAAIGGVGSARVLPWWPMRWRCRLKTGSSTRVHRCGLRCLRIHGELGTTDCAESGVAWLLALG